jgi:hypothetical protein
LHIVLLKKTFMKKQLIIGLFLISTLSIAQKRVGIGASFGVGKTSMNAPIGYTGIISYRGGIVTDIKIVGPLGVRAEAGCESYGIESITTHTNASGGALGKIKNIERSSSVDIPVMAKLSTGVKVQPYFCICAGPSILMSAKNYYKGVESIPNSTTDPNAKIDVSDKYNSMYWSLYNVVGIDLKGDKITPFIEVRLKHSLGDITPTPAYGSLNSITANIGFKF